MAYSTYKDSALKLVRIIFLFFYLSSFFTTWAQPHVNIPFNKNSLFDGAQTYALVVGISTYYQPGIPSLQFADKDAKIFAEYLASLPGGNVPAENITVLTNEKATTSAVYNEIYNLKKNAKENDVVYIYFSGHGDLENETMYKDGFLICYDSPPNNYVMQALSIDFLNKMANTIAVEKKAKVILITDACHSGKLTDQAARASILVGEQLRKSEQNEIRITSSSSDQLSNEMKEWGGGRGVFSWYLVNGLKGMADTQNKGYVSLGDIDTYMQKSLKNDPILQRNNLVQTPVLSGQDKYVLAKVDPLIKKKIANEMARTTAVEPVASDVPLLMISLNNAPDDANLQTADDYFFDILNNEDLTVVTEQRSLNTRNIKQVPFEIINYLKQNIKYNKNQLTTLESLLEKDYYFEKFCNRLAGKFDEAGQKIILSYLHGDEAELERRRYYNARNNGYKVYAEMFGIGSRLATADHPLRTILRVKELYFSAVADRILIPVTDNPEKLIGSAFKAINEALEMEKFAAYLYNERGVIHLYQKNKTAAENDFIEATRLSPDWVIPHTNLMGIYVSNNHLEKAEEKKQIALSINPGFQTIYTHGGSLNAAQRKYLMAEESLMKSISINERSFFPFERLGEIFVTTTDFHRADSFFYESDKRKKRDHYVFPLDIDASGVADVLDISQDARLCDFDTSKININDPIGNFAWASLAEQEGNYELAEKKYKVAIAANLHHPLAYHYLGRLHYQQNNWAAAENDFTFARKYFLTPDSFSITRAKEKSRFSRGADKGCINRIYDDKYYKDSTENLYFLAQVLENKNDFIRAGNIYEELIVKQPNFEPLYIKHSAMLEHGGSYESAEKVLATLYRINNNIEEPLFSFYKRMNDTFPSSPVWYYKLGLYCHKVLGKSQPNSNPWYEYDTKTFSPYLNKEVYATLDKSFKLPLRYNMPGTKMSMSILELMPSPYTNGIAALQSADSLYGRNNENSIDITHKLGDLNYWQGSPSSALPWYQVSLDLKPANVAVRMKLVSMADLSFKYQLALDNLQYLHEHKQASTENEIKYSRYLSLAAQYQKADSIFSYIQTIYPFRNEEVLYNKAVNELLQGNDNEALAIFNTIKFHDTDGIIAYNKARIYASLGKEDLAFTMLKTALSDGFNFGFVLQKDPMVRNLRNTRTWNNLVKNYEENFKRYK